MNVASHLSVDFHEGCLLNTKLLQHFVSPGRLVLDEVEDPFCEIFDHVLRLWLPTLWQFFSLLRSGKVLSIKDNFFKFF